MSASAITSAQRRSASSGRLVFAMWSGTLVGVNGTDKTALPRFGDHPALGGDAIAANKGFDRAEGQLDPFIGAPGNKVVAAGRGTVAIRIAAHQHDVGIAADFKGAFGM